MNEVHSLPCWLRGAALLSEHSMVLQNLTNTNSKPLQIMVEHKPAFFAVNASHCAICEPFFSRWYQHLHPLGTAVIEIEELGK